MGSKHALASQDDMAIYRRLVRYLNPYWIKLVVAVVLMLVVSATAAGIAYLVKPALDEIFIARKADMLHLLPMVIAGVYLLRAVCDYGRYYLMADVGQHIVLDLRNELYAHIQKLSMSFFARTPSGVLVSRITNDVNLVQASVTNALTAFVRESFTMLGLIVVVFYHDWQLALISMIIFPIVVFPISRFGKRLKHFSTKSMHVMGNVMSILTEAIKGVRIVKAYNMEDYERERFECENRRYYRNWMRRLSIRAISNPMMELIGGLLTALIIWLGGMRVFEGQMTTGEFFSFVTALGMLYSPIRKLNTVNMEIQEGIAAARRVFEVMDTEPAIVDSEDALELTSCRGDVALHDLSFSYDGCEETALEHVSIHARPGETIALVGESGAGKSTIANLIPRLFEATDGAVLVDDHDVRDLSVISLRRHIAMVTQDMILFDDTVAANIAYGSPDADQKQIVEAARAAFAHDFISAMPDGYETRVGESGVRLSGGQRQRICIARAILRDAPILILDEATSALDSQSEREVQAAMDILMQGRTTFIIAHRLSTILGADRIVVLDKGKVVEEGPHDELMDLGGHYSHLHQLQFGCGQ